MSERTSSVRRMQVLSCAVAATGLLALCPSGADATTITWSTEATSNAWSLGSNWVGGTAPVAGDDVVLVTAAKLPTTPEAGVAYNKVTWNGSGAAAQFRIAQPLTIGAGGVANRPLNNNIPLVFDGAVTLSASQTWVNSSGGTNGGTYVNAEVLGGGNKLTIDGGLNGNSHFMFTTNSPNWNGGFESRGGIAAMANTFLAGTTATPFGTGTIKLTNQATDASGNNIAQSVSITLSGNFTSSSDAITLANNIVFNNATASGAMSMRIGSNVVSGAPPFNAGVIVGANQKPTFIISGDITGTAPVGFSLRNDRGGVTSRVIYSGNNSYTAPSTTFGIVTNGPAGTYLEIYANNSAANSSAFGNGTLTMNPATRLGGTGRIAPTEANNITFSNWAINGVAYDTGLKPGGIDGVKGTLTIDLSGSSGQLMMNVTANAAGLYKKTFVEFDLGAINASDKVVVVGNTNAVAGTATDVLFNATGNPLFINNDGAMVQGTYTLFSFTGGATYSGYLSEPTWGGSAGLPEGWSATLVHNADSIQLQVVPEPTALALLGLGGTLFLGGRRRAKTRHPMPST